MSAKRKIGLVCLCLGAVMLIGALALYQSNRHEAMEAEASSREVMTQLIEVMTSEQSETPATSETPASNLPQNPRPPIDWSQDFSPDLLPLVDTTMETVEVEGYQYVGFLTIPALELELPVMDEWDYERLRIAPCRFSGTLLGGDLVIAAHNYLRHFGHLQELPIGSEILFTDVNGNSTRFTVAELEILQPTDVEYMTAGEYDLTLFTCTYGGATRFTVRCVREKA